jgi:tRNA dimethylallyltransferase
MLADGFLDEMRRLRTDPRLIHALQNRDLPSMRAVGYRQAWRHLDGVTDATGFRAEAIAATRQLAKRQFTWLRGERDARWFDPQADRVALETALALFLGSRLAV